MFCTNIVESFDVNDEFLHTNESLTDFVSFETMNCADEYGTDMSTSCEDVVSIEDDAVKGIAISV